MEKYYLVWSTKGSTICAFGLPWLNGGSIHSEEEANKKKEMLEGWGYTAEVEVTTLHDINSRKNKGPWIDRYKK